MLRRTSVVFRAVNENGHLQAQVNTKYPSLLRSAIHAESRVQLLLSIPCHPAGLLMGMGHPPNRFCFECGMLSFFFCAELALEGKSV